MTIFPFRRRAITALLACILLNAVCTPAIVNAQRRRQAGASATGRAVVVDERLSALRQEPTLNAPLLQRLGRGRTVTIMGSKRATDGVVFNRVAVSRQTRGWIQAESLISTRRADDDARLLRLARDANGFDRIECARLMLEIFPRSSLRPQALLLLGDAAEAAAERLTRDAQRRLKISDMQSNPATPHSYMLNFQGLDRFNREGVTFVYDEAANRFHYDGASWREILRRHPNSVEVAVARERLAKLATSPASK